MKIIKRYYLKTSYFLFLRIKNCFLFSYFPMCFPIFYFREQNFVFENNYQTKKKILYNNSQKSFLKIIF